MPVATAAGLSTRIEQAINQSLVLDPLCFVLRGIVIPRHKLPEHPKDKLLIFKVLPVACGGSGFHLGVRTSCLLTVAAAMGIMTCIKMTPLNVGTLECRPVP